MILIIDHFDSFSHNLYQLFTSIQKEIEVIRCNQLQLSNIQDLSPDMIVLSPGPKGPQDTGISLPLLESELSNRIPILGICLGFQTMAHYWGCPVELASEVVHGKTLALDLNQHPIFAGLKSPSQVARYHSLCVSNEQLPKNVSPLLVHKNMLMAAEDLHRPWIGLQFHPESFLTPEGRPLVQNIYQYLKNKNI